MTEIFHDGTRLVPSREAARRFAITNDYIGRLCKQDKVSGSLISGSWYVNEESLRDFLLKTNREKYERREALREQRAHAYREAQSRLLGDTIPAKRDVVRAKKLVPHPKTPLRIHASPRRVPKAFSTFAQRGLAVMFAVVVVVGGLRFSDASVFQVAREVLPAAAVMTGRSELATRGANSVIADFLGINRDTESYWIWYETNGQTIDQPTYSSGIANEAPSIVERVVDAISPSAISEALLNARLAALESRLIALISLVPPTSSVAPVYHYYVDNSSGIGGSGFDDIDITNSTYTGGTITDATISGGSVTATDFDGVLPVVNGGTGTSTYATGDILYADSSSTLGRLAQGSNGQVLKVVGGNLVWSQDIAGGGGSGAFATTSDDLAIYVADPTDVVIIGDIATTTTGNILEVVGNTLMRGALTAYNTITAPIFTATSTSATSTMPRLNITGSLGIGSDYITDISGDGLSVQSGALSLDDSGDWGGTFDGLEGSYYLANSFSTTSASYFLSQNQEEAFSTTSAEYFISQQNLSGFSTTSAEYWKSVNNFFSTTSAAYFLSENQEEAFSTTSADFWQTQRNFFSTTSTDYWKTVNNFFSTTSADFWKTANDFFSTTSASYFLAQNQGAAFSTTSADHLLSTYNKGFFFSTTSANHFLTQNGSLGFSTTSNDYWLTQRNFFSTTSADAWKDQRNFFSTTSASHFSSLGLAFSSTSADYFLSQNQGAAFSTTSANYFIHASTTVPKLYTANTFTALQTFGNASSSIFSADTICLSTDCRTEWPAGSGSGFSTTSADYWKSVNNFFSTTSASYFLSENQGAAFSSTSANYFIHSSTTVPKLYSSNTWSGDNIFNGTFTLSSLNGPLQANNGVVSATTSIGVLYGGTGLTTAPSYGQVLVGNASGGYTLTATSSLGIAGSGSSFAYPFPNDATSTMLTFSNGLISVGSTTINGNATTTGMQGVGSLFINGERFTDLTGSGLLNTAGALTLDTSGNWSGTFDGQEGSYYLANSFSTTSADAWKDTRNFFSTTSASYFSSLGLAFSTTSANYFVHSSTTIPKTYTANTFTALQTFGNASSTLFSSSYASTTNLFANTASTSNLTISALQNGLLKVDASGVVSLATAGTDYQNFGYLFPSNATSTLLSFNGGLTSYASSTIGNGTQAGGLTISGGATTTGSLWVGGDITSNAFIGDGSQLTNLAATNVSGTLGTINGTAFNRGDSITITAASSTLLSDANSFTALQVFTNASSTLFSSNYASSTNLFAGAFTLGTLNGPLHANNGLVSATSSVLAIYGGTGQTSYVVGDILYADSTGSLARLPIGGSGQVLKVTGGLPVWGADITSGGGGGATAFSTTSDSLAIYPSDTSDVFILGNSATATANSILEVFGRSYFSQNLGIGTTSPWRTLSVTGNSDLGTNALAGSFTATSTSVNTFPTLLSTNATTTSLGINSETFTDLTGTGLQNVGGALTLNATGDWTGTFDGQEGSYYLANSFSTTSANHWSSLGLGFSSTSANYWQTTRDFFSTTSADYWETQQTSRTADDLTNNSIEDLSDVAAITENYGDLLYWNGTSWADIATSSLGLVTSGDLGAYLSLASWYATTTDGLTEGLTNRYYDDTLVQDYLDTITKGFFFSTTSADAWKDQRNFFSTTSASYFSSLGLAFSTTSADYFLSQNQGAAFSTTSAINFVHSSTTIPKTYSTNTFTGANTFNSTLTFGNYTNGALATDASGNLYTFSTSTWSFASSTLLADNNAWTGTNTFASLIATNATTTSLGINSETFTDLTGTGLQNVGGALTLNATGDWTGTFDGQEGSYYLANSFSTTSADAWKDTRNFFSTTSAEYFVHSSTTIPKTYTANTFTALQTFNSGITSNALTLGSLNGPLQANNGVVSATTSIGVLYGGTGLTSAPAYGQLLLGNASGGYTLTATSSLGLGTISAIGPIGQQSTGPSVAFATSTGMFNGLTTGLTIVGSGNTQTFTPSLSGTLDNSGLTNSTISGISLGSNLADLTATNGTLTFSGSYNGSTARTVALNLGNANTWTALQNFANASSTLFSASYASTTNLFANTASTSNLTISALQNGLLKVGSDGTVSLAVLGTDYQNFGYLFPSNATTTLLAFNGGLIANASSSIAALSSTFSTSTNATSTNLFATNARFTNATATSLGINSETFTDLTGTGLQNVGGALTLNATGDWTGTFDGQEGSYYLANSFSTTSANHWSSLGLGFSTTSADAWKDTRNFFSTTSASYFSSLGLAFSTTSADYFLSQNQGAAFSSTSANYFIHSSTTIPKLYSSNTWTGANIFNDTFTLGSLNGPLQANNGVVSATTSIGVLYGGTGLTSAPAYGQLLLGNASGGYTLTATSSLGLPTFAYLFPSNATSTLLNFNGGLTAYASSTIGAGGQTTGLTISGGATTTGYLNVLGTATSSFAGSLAVSSSGTSTFANGIQLSGGCFRDTSGSCITIPDLSIYVDGAGNGSTNRVAYWSDNNTLTSDEDFSFDGTTVTTRDLLVQHTAPILSLNDSDTTGTDFRLDVADGSATFKADISAALSNEFFAWTTNNNEKMRLTEAGRLGVGTSSPYAKITAWGDTSGKIFEAVTSASSTALSVSATGFGTTTLSGLNISGSATTTSNVGFNLSAGCYAINGACISGGGSSNWTDNGTYLSPLTGTDGILVAASSTIGAGGQATGLTISGGATTTGTAYFATNVGIGRTPDEFTSLVANGAQFTSTLIEDFTSDVYTPTGGDVHPSPLLRIYNTNFGTGMYSGMTLQTTREDFTSTRGYMGVIAPASGFSPSFVWGQQTGASSYAERMRIDESGNVGIGTTTPYGKLAVWGSTTGNIFEAVTSASSTALSVSATGFGTTTLSGLNISGSATSTSNVGLHITSNGLRVSALASCDTVDTDASGNFICGTDATGGGGGDFPFTPGTNFGATTNSTTTNLSLYGGLNASSTVRFGNAGVGGFIFDSSTGRLGLGTTSPWAQLSINPDGIGSAPAFAIGSSTANMFSVTRSGVGSIFNFGMSSTSTIPNNTANAWTIATSSSASPLFRIDTTSGAEEVSIGSPYATTDVLIGNPSGTGDSNLQFGEDNNAWSVGNYSTDKSFRIASSTNFTSNVALTITKGTELNVGIGTTSPWRTLSVVGTVAINGLSAVAGTDQSVCIDNTTKELTTQSGDTCAVSSARYKNTIESLDIGGLEMLRTFRPVSFLYNQDAASTTHWGFIAEELASSSPNLAAWNPDGSVQTLNSVAITAVLAKALQELDAKVSLATGQSVSGGTFESITASTTNTSLLCLNGDCRSAWGSTGTSTIDLSAYASKLFVGDATTTLTTNFGSALTNATTTLAADFNALVLSASTSLSTSFDSALSNAMENRASSTASAIAFATSTLYSTILGDLNAATTSLYSLLQSELLAMNAATTTDIDITPLSATTSALELTTASSTATTTPWVASFASSTEALRAGIESLGETIVHVFTRAFYATVGIFEKVFAREVHTDLLCVSGEDGETCITKDQLDALLAGAAVASEGEAPEPEPEPETPPAEETPEEIPAEESPTEEAPAEEVPAEESPEEETPVEEEVPAEEPEAEPEPESTPEPIADGGSTL